eukprot:SAG22_NODE_243_length_14055_cov_3.073015_17_plen_70_part_00
MLMQFFTSYADPVTLEPITHRGSIAAKYMRGWFWVDLVSVFPTNYIVKLTGVEKVRRRRRRRRRRRVLR